MRRIAGKFCRPRRRAARTVVVKGLRIPGVSCLYAMNIPHNYVMLFATRTSSCVVTTFWRSNEEIDKCPLIRVLYLGDLIRFSLLQCLSMKKLSRPQNSIYYRVSTIQRITNLPESSVVGSTTGVGYFRHINHIYLSTVNTA